MSDLTAVWNSFCHVCCFQEKLQIMSPPAATTVSTHLSSGDSCGSSYQTSDKILDRYEEYTHETKKESQLKDSVNSNDYPSKIFWGTIILWVIYHLLTMYGIYLSFTSAKWETNVFTIILYNISSLGITAGVHRLWSHRSYKAKLPLRIFLAFLFTLCFQKSIFGWARDHRIHHKFSETNADPHNSNRGFFFSHIGWLLCEKHPDVAKKEKTVYMEDLKEDPVVRFQKKYFYRLAFLCCYFLPTAFAMYMWNETFINSLLVAGVVRHCLQLHQTLLLNSAAHKWGNRPYDVNISPRDNVLFTLGAFGEGFHNYHHAFPFDYSTSEYGIKYNITTAFLNVMAFLGLAYDLRTASKSVVQARALRTGPQSLKNAKVNNQNLSLKRE